MDILFELRASLDVDSWDGAAGLASLYDYVIGELVQAQLKLDANRVNACRRLIEPLRDAWHEALATP